VTLGILRQVCCAERSGSSGEDQEHHRGNPEFGSIKHQRSLGYFGLDAQSSDLYQSARHSLRMTAIRKLPGLISGLPTTGRRKIFVRDSWTEAPFSLLIVA
jgi:hypothetical protein